MNDIQKPVRFQKPELSLGALFGILFFLFSAGGIILLMVYSLGTPWAFIVTCLIFVLFLALILWALGKSRYIYVDADKILIHFRLGFQKNRTISISDCKAFFPYTYFTVAGSGSGNMYGIIIILPDDSRLLLRQIDGRASFERVLPHDIRRLIEIFKAKNIKNINKHADYSITENFFSMKFRQREYVALEEVLALEK